MVLHETGGEGPRWPELRARAPPDSGCRGDRCRSWRRGNARARAGRPPTWRGRGSHLLPRGRDVDAGDIALDGDGRPSAHPGIQRADEANPLVERVLEKTIGGPRHEVEPEIERVTERIEPWPLGRFSPAKQEGAPVRRPFTIASRGRPTFRISTELPSESSGPTRSLRSRSGGSTTSATT